MVLYNRILRALKRSGVFFTLSSILVIICLTGDSIIPNQVNSRNQVIVGLAGGFCLFMGFYFFVRDFGGRFSTRESKIENFVLQNYIYSEKRKFLAVSAMYFVYPYESIECLKQYNLQDSDILSQWKQSLQDSWGIVDHETAISTLNWLLNEGHRGSDNYVKEAVEVVRNIKDPNCSVDSITKLIDNIKRISFSKYNGKTNSTIDEAVIFSISNINAWDYVRGSGVAKHAYNFGYISEEETWYYLEKFFELTKKDFSSWEEFAVSYLVGRFIWYGDVEQEDEINRISELFSHYSEEEVEQHKNNVWKMVSLLD